jgi:hypothetical protein
MFFARYLPQARSERADLLPLENCDGDGTARISAEVVVHLKRLLDRLDELLMGSDFDPNTKAQLRDNTNRGLKNVVL